MKLPKTIQLDVSDTNIYECAANPGEWAVTGSFSFSDIDPDGLSRKQRFAFDSGWVGVDTGGHSTLVQVTSASDDDFNSIVAILADWFVRDFGAPSIATAMPVARDEVLYVASLCEFDESTLLTLSRNLGPEGIHEIVRPVSDSRQSDQLIKIWELVEE